MGKLEAAINAEHLTRTGSEVDQKNLSEAAKLLVEAFYIFYKEDVKLKKEKVRNSELSALTQSTIN